MPQRLQNMLDIRSMLMSLIPILVCLTLHELAHGYVAYRLGDGTAKRLGRLTLNPLAHVDPMGAVMLLLFGFGYAKPVPVDMRNFRNPKMDMALTALAGPIMNILITFTSFFLYGALLSAGIYGIPAEMLYYTGIISASLAAFNLLPIPPLDGSKIVSAFLPDSMYESWISAGRFGGIVLIVLCYFGVVNTCMAPLVDMILRITGPAVAMGMNVGRIADITVILQAFS